METKDWRMIQMTELWKRTLYTKKVKWLIHEIFEYDISKANISILLQYGYISEREFNMYAQMNRLQRQIAIGRLQQDPKYARVINDGFVEARKALILTNNIQDEDIISIKKDALYVLNRLNHTDFGYIRFTLRGNYSIFLYCKGLEIYFYYNEREDDYNIEIKGINDDKLYLHQDYISFICDVLRLVQKNNVKDAIQLMMEFGKQYNAGSLPISYYREFNADSMYRIGNFGMLDANESYKSVLNPSYNYQFNTELFGILTEIMYTR